MNASLFAEDFSFKPYWWDEAAPREAPVETLPANVDVAIVGAGYTGLSAGLTACRSGRSILIMDSDMPGFGASSRNGGMVSPRLKISFPLLRKRVGLEKAVALSLEGRRAFDYAVQFIESEQIQCHLSTNGRFIGAHSPGRFEAMERLAEDMRKHLGAKITLVPKTEQRDEIGSDQFFGGEVVEEFGGLQPALYLSGLLERVQRAGATVAGQTHVNGIRQDGNRFDVSTSAGTVRARDVIVATNGYTGKMTPWMRRRVVPIGSQIIATEPVAPAVMARLMPKNRMMGDSRKLHHYFRPSPDGTRMIFGGRVLSADIEKTAALLHRNMVAMFPVLADTKMTHTWSGNVAMTFDMLPHIGVNDGVHYAMGFCGTGVAMATYLGHKLALRVTGAKDAATAFDEMNFPTRPFYYGRPWFLPVALAYYGWKDRRGR